MRARLARELVSGMVVSISLTSCMSGADVTTETSDPVPPASRIGDGAGDGASRDGASRDGASRDGASRDGASRDGASRDGANSDGAVGDGPGAGGSSNVAPDPNLPEGDSGSGGQPDRLAEDGDGLALPATPLALLDVSPPLGATGVAAGVPVTLTFSADVDPASATSLAIELTRDGALPISGSIDVRGPRVLFVPSEPVALTNAYAWSYQGSLRSTGGAEWSGSAEGTFQTREGSWGAPENLGSGGDNPRIGVDAAGNAIAIWNEVGALASGAASIGVGRFTPGTGWQRVPSPASCGPQCSPSLVAGGREGTFEIAWFAMGSLNVRGYDASAGFGATTRLQARSGPPSAAGSIAGGQLWLAADLAQGISSVRTTDGITWQSPLSAFSSDARTSSAGPVLIADDAERARVFWVESAELLGSTFSGGSWGAPKAVASSRGDVTAVGLTGSGIASGDALLAWEEARASEGDPSVTTSTLGVALMAADGSMREDAPPTAAGAGGSSASPAVSMNTRGEALFTWLESAGDPNDPDAPAVLWGAFHAAGTSEWAAPLQLSVDADGVARPPAVAIDPSGNGHALWVSAALGGDATVRAARFRRDSGLFDTPGVVSADASVSPTLTRGQRSGNDNCQLAVDAQGRAIAIWAAPDGGIWATRFE